MRPTRGPVSRLTSSAERRLLRLETLARAIRVPLDPADRRTLAFIAIEAANLWAQYSRCLYLSAAMGALDPAGRRTVSTPASNESDALDLAVYALRPKLRGTRKKWTRQELPDFQNKGHLTKTLKYIAASISPDVDAAVSYNSRVLFDLPTIRNFYAHKGLETAVAASSLARHYGITKRLSPPALLFEVAPSAGDVLIREWLSDLTAILRLMPR